jgi:hypothetical protein
VSASYCLLGKTYTNQKNKLYHQQEIIQQQLTNYQQIQVSDLTIIPNLKAKLQHIDRELNTLESKLNLNFCPGEGIDWQSWWRDHWGYFFNSFVIISVFALIVAGTYLLISDLAKEEHRGTLNFIRLSPETETNILTGKILGVPSLIYLFILTVIPLHIWAGYSAGIHLTNIFTYYLILATSCFLFYSMAMLFGLSSNRFSNFQPWLGSGCALIFLFTTIIMITSSSSEQDLNHALDWLRFISPWEMVNYLFPQIFHPYNPSSIILPIKKIQIFYYPIGASLFSLLGFHLINYAICSHGIWQVMKRRFRNSNSTIFSKRQSYLFMAYIQIMFLGLSMQESVFSQNPIERISWMMSINVVIGLILIFTLSPQRQIIQDWARYRHQNRDHKQSLWQDLMYGEKSPAILAIAINIAIASTPVIIWNLLFTHQPSDNVRSLIFLVLSMVLMMIYASITQLMLLMKNNKRYLWTIITIVTLTLSPSIISQILYLPDSSLWLFSALPWVALQKTLETMTTITTLMAFLAELSIVALLNFQLTRQVRLLGESSTKALFTG